MKIFKIILLSFIGLVALLFFTGLFTKKDYNVEREVTIQKPKAEVFAYIKLLKNQDNFSKWASLDPLMKKSYIGTDGTVGFVSSWQSNIEEVGHGEQEITKIVEGERIDYELRFLKPFASTSSAYMTTEVVDENQTKVKWGFNGHMSYPSNLMLLFLDFEELIGNDFQTGLDNLKIILEK